MSTKLWAKLQPSRWLQQRGPGRPAPTVTVGFWLTWNTTWGSASGLSMGKFHMLTFHFMLTKQQQQKKTPTQLTKFLGSNKSTSRSRRKGQSSGRLTVVLQLEGFSEEWARRKQIYCMRMLHWKIKIWIQDPKIQSMLLCMCKEFPMFSQGDAWKGGNTNNILMRTFTAA